MTVGRHAERFDADEELNVLEMAQISAEESDYADDEIVVVYAMAKGGEYSACFRFEGDYSDPVALFVNVSENGLYVEDMEGVPYEEWRNSIESDVPAHIADVRDRGSMMSIAVERPTLRDVDLIQDWVSEYVEGIEGWETGYRVKRDALEEGGQNRKYGERTPDGNIRYQTGQAAI